eukprot:TRINITY_DN19786_c1_g1_i1.p5 TRINITY_DN19786_c1_g1~~TRINITY_DN19786_c1_g1_i1.p5  ORF type:complete len:107 (+),score=9.79 TRINITY_DN19786_c1_g1_i1:99-419(+)
MREGEVDSVMDGVRLWSRTAESSLVRYYVFQCLSFFCPPYSGAYANFILQLMFISGVRRGRRDIHRGKEATELVHNFANACIDLDFEPPLTQKEKQYLSEIRQVWH